MRLLDYECQTTFWEDFSIAGLFGKEAVRDTYSRAKVGRKEDRIYGTALSMCLTINVTTGMGSKIRGLVNFTLSFGKNIMNGY